jgi:hypothetical protein
MKKATLVMTVVFLLVACFAQAQSKKDLENELAKTKTEKDSVQKVAMMTKVKLDSTIKAYDSVYKAFLVYESVYKTLAEKVTRYAFDPTKTAIVIDSLRAKRDSLIAGSDRKTLAARDSLKKVSWLRDSLVNDANNLRYVVAQCIGKGTIPRIQSELNGTWTLNFQWYELSNDSLKTGINLRPSPTEYPVAIKIVFIDQEMAEVTLSNATTVKCFYKITGFSADKPYIIELSRGADLNVRLSANPTGYGELQVSYKKGNGYFSGYMRKIM